MSVAFIDRMRFMFFLRNFFDVVDDDSCQRIHTVIYPLFCNCMEFIWRSSEVIFYFFCSLSKSFFCQNRRDMTSGDYTTVSIHRYGCWFSLIFFCVKGFLTVDLFLSNQNAVDLIHYLLDLHSAISMLFHEYHLAMASYVFEIFLILLWPVQIIVFFQTWVP